MYFAVPPRLSISDGMAYLKGESSLMILTDIQNIGPSGEIVTFGQAAITLRLSALSTKRQSGSTSAIRERKTDWKEDDLGITFKGG